MAVPAKSTLHTATTERTESTGVVIDLKAKNLAETGAPQKAWPPSKTNDDQNGYEVIYPRPEPAAVPNNEFKVSSEPSDEEEEEIKRLLKILKHGLFQVALRPRGNSYPVLVMLLNWSLIAGFTFAAYHLAWLGLLAWVAQSRPEMIALLTTAGVAAAGAIFFAALQQFREDILPRLWVRFMCVVIIAVAIADSAQIAATFREFCAYQVIDQKVSRLLGRFCYLSVGLTVLWALATYRQSSRLPLGYQHRAWTANAFQEFARHVLRTLIK
jgi:hypothetical protein